MPDLPVHLSVVPEPDGELRARVPLDFETPTNAALSPASSTSWRLLRAASTNLSRTALYALGSSTIFPTTSASLSCLAVISHMAAGRRIRIDRQRARPYDGHQATPPPDPSPRPSAKRRQGGIPHVQEGDGKNPGPHRRSQAAT
jgi:hypothetical protein